MLSRNIGDVRITLAEIRAGIVNPETWPKVFVANNVKWAAMGGCPLGIGVSQDCENPTFNFFPTSRDAVIEWSDLRDSGTAHVASDVAEGAVIDVAKLPFLNHKQTFERPTLVAFEVTGHVMLGIIYNKRGGRGPEIHILNPWSMTESQQFKDVFELINAKLGYGGRKVIVVDITSELERRLPKGKSINFQVYEKQGFCTLWVGIFAGAVIPFLPALDASVKSNATTTGVVSNATLDLYYKAYDIIGRAWAMKVAENIPMFNEERCIPTASAAVAVVELASIAAAANPAGGKRKYKRQTKRKPLYRRRWTRKRRNLR
jgi:hypothetical protein